MGVYMANVALQCSLYNHKAVFVTLLLSCAGILAGLKQLQRRLRTNKRIASLDSTPTSHETTDTSFTDEE